MSTGLSNKITGQVGEYLVVAELGRRSFIATPFAGNVPDIDILCYVDGTSFPIQVKSINKGKGGWQFDARRFLNIELKKDRQRVLGMNTNLNRKIICVFVILGDELGEDKFYIFKLGWLQDYFIKEYKPRKKPQKYESFHCAIWDKDLPKNFQNNWKVIKK